MKRIVMVMVLALTLLFAAAGQSALGAQEKATRTIMLYVCGSDLETSAGMATYNLHQILKSNFSANEDVRFVVMTGGSSEWQFNKGEGDDYLCDPSGKKIADVSTEYNQLWEAKGADAKENPGRMVLLDGDGINGAEGQAVKSEDELMSDPETLKAFINYSVENYPAEKYDIILWDHGGGPTNGFGVDEHSEDGNPMTMPDIVDALSDNAVIDSVGKFDFIDFDACLMNSVEYNVALAPLTDYYIASPETEPGYGQSYEGWLNMLGKNPEESGFTLGKTMVDDFIAFYDAGYEDGSRQEGTLAVVDTKKFVESSFIDSFSKMTKVLRDQAVKNAFYDELESSRGSIQYGQCCFYDVGNMAAQLSMVLSEVKGDEIDITDNEYTEAAIDILKVLNDKSIIYASGTKGMKAKGEFYRTADGKTNYTEVNGQMGTSGMYIYFSGQGPITDAATYYDAVADSMEKVSAGAGATAVKDYAATMMDYALILGFGSTIDSMIEEGTAKKDINYDSVMGLLKEELDPVTLPGQSTWAQAYAPVLDRRDGNADGKIENEAEVEKWLKDLINQQAAEAVTKDNATIKTIKEKNGTGYMINLEDIKKRVIDSISVKLIGEFPIANEYIDNLDRAENSQAFIDYLKSDQVSMILNEAKAKDAVDSKIFENIIEWINAPNGSWRVDPIEEKWFTVTDAKGIIHAVEVDGDEDSMGVIGEVPDMNGDGQPELAEVKFKDGKPTGLRTATESKIIRLSELNKEITFTPIHYVDILGFKQFRIPISTPFTLTSDNYNNISLGLTDIDKISDITETHRKFVVTDIYDQDIDITKDIAGELIDIELATVKKATYNGKNQKPIVTYDGKVLKEGVDYNIIDLENNGVFKEVGKHKVMIEGIGNFTDMDGKIFEIVKAPKTVGKVSISTKGSVAKKTIKVSLSKAKNATNYKVFYKKASAKKWKSVSTKGKRTYTIKKLKSGALYQVKAAAYGKDGSKQIKGSDSKIRYRYLAKTYKHNAKAGKKKITFSWKKTKGASGYEILYSTMKNMNGAEKVTVKGGKTTKKAIKNLKKGKRYYIQIRPYKTYKGNKYVGILSSVKKPASAKVK